MGQTTIFWLLRLFLQCPILARPSVNIWFPLKPNKCFPIVGTTPASCSHGMLCVNILWNFLEPERQLRWTLKAVLWNRKKIAFQQDKTRMQYSTLRLTEILKKGYCDTFLSTCVVYCRLPECLSGDLKPFRDEKQLHLFAVSYSSHKSWCSHTHKGLM